MSESDSNNKKIAKNTIYMGIQQALILLISLYTSRVILKALGVEDFGIYNVVCGFVSMFAFLNTSMTNAIQRFYNYELGKNGEEGALRIYNNSIVIQAVLAIIIVILTETIGLWYLHEKMVLPPERFQAALYIFHFSVVSLIFVVFQIPYSAAIMAYEKMGYFAFVAILDSLLKLGIALYIPYADHDTLITYGFLIMIISVIDWFMYYFYAKKRLTIIHFRFLYTKEIFRKMLNFTGWNLFGSLSGILKDQGINMILNLFLVPL